MRLLINTPAVNRSSRGVQRYTLGVLKHLQWPQGIDQVPAANLGALSRLRELMEPGHRDAILWTPCQRGSLRALHHVVTVHDCINIEYVHRDDPRLPLYRHMMGLLFRRAEAVVAISHATRAAVLRNFSLPAERIVVIPSGMDPIFTVPAPQSTDHERPFVLLVTNALPHKNTLITCKAWSRCRGAREGVELRIIGSLPDSARHFCDVAGAPLRLQRDVDDEVLAAAYRQCLFLIAPSLSEGHDLPVAEALALGAEVLCSDIDVHREYYGGRVAFFDPLSEDALVEGLDRALTMPRPWFPAQPTPIRQFADVALDYAALFHRIEARHG